MEAIKAAVFLLLLIFSAAFGMVAKTMLPAKHQSRETTELVQLVITMLVTFASIVMGLLVYSVKGSFDAGESDMAAYAGQIVRLDTTLRAYGAEADPIRAQLRAYTAGVIVSTWPNEPISAPVQPLPAGPIMAPSVM